MKDSKIYFMALVSVLFGLLAFAQATPPERINYQGVVRDSLNNPLNGLVTMTFRFYDDPSAGTMLWEETYSALHSPQITAANGLFTVQLGDPDHRTAGTITSFSDVFGNNPAVYLAIAVGLDAEMTPRVKVVAAPFALNAMTLGGNSVLSATQGGTGISSSGPAGNLLVSDGSSWTSSSSAASCANADTLDSYHAGYFLDTSSATQTKTGKIILNSAGDYGIDSTGTTSGGYFKNADGTSNVSLGLENLGLQAYGLGRGGYFTNGYSGFAYLAHIEPGAEAGIYAASNSHGGIFEDSDSSGQATVASGDYGIRAQGSGAGGYFLDSDHSGYAYVGYGDYGILGMGNTYGGRFEDLDHSGYANVGAGDWGIRAYGNAGGAHCYDLDSDIYCEVGYDIYKVYGSGTVSFVQNHPTEKDKVIVYACPEGDEVATYTRGTAKLVNGEAHVKLGETFQWVTNPDIGLTAHLTPKSDCKGLYSESISTTELVVRELGGGKSDTAFDYIVYGLRIGFEESSIVQEKQQESYIPSFKNHRERYAKYPGLRAFNALERFKGMESSVHGIDEASIDLSRARTLKDAIHEYDPATDPPADRLFGHESAARSPALPKPPAPTGETLQSAAKASAVTERPSETAQNSARSRIVEDAGANITQIYPAAERLTVSQSVSAGDVLVMITGEEAALQPCAKSADPMVAGIALQDALDGAASVATFGCASVKADAAQAPIAKGDLLVTSPVPGHAMKAIKPIEPGTVVGKALEPLESGTGLIKIVVMLR